jgi:hypothetical protein
MAVFQCTYEWTRRFLLSREGCDSVPPHANRVRVARYMKEIISVVC